MRTIQSIHAHAKRKHTQERTLQRRVQGKGGIGSLERSEDSFQIASEYGISPDLVKDWKKQAKEVLGECFRRGGRKSEMEKKDERIANLERLLGKMETGLCPQALEMALRSGRRPRIFNTDQGSQYSARKTGSQQSEQKAYESA